MNPAVWIWTDLALAVGRTVLAAGVTVTAAVAAHLALDVLRRPPALRVNHRELDRIINRES